MARCDHPKCESAFCPNCGLALTGQMDADFVAHCIRELTKARKWHAYKVRMLAECNESERLDRVEYTEKAHVNVQRWERRLDVVRAGVAALKGQP